MRRGRRRRRRRRNGESAPRLSSGVAWMGTSCAGRSLLIARQCSTTSGRSPWISSQVSASGSEARCSSPRWTLAGASMSSTFGAARGSAGAARCRVAGSAAGPARSAVPRIGMEPRPASDQAERIQQRAGEDRRAHRIGRRVEHFTIPVDRLEAVPERVGGVLELRRDLAQQPGASELAEASAEWPDRRIL